MQVSAGQASPDSTRNVGAARFDVSDFLDDAIAIRPASNEVFALREGQGKGERVVVGSRDRAMDLGLVGANGSSRKDPIDNSPLL